MYAIIELTKTGIIMVCQVRTVEEAFDMLRKYREWKPTRKYEMMEMA